MIKKIYQKVISFCFIFLTLPIWGMEKSCSNPLGCEFALQCQKIYAKKNPSFFVSKESDIENKPEVRLEIAKLAACIPNLGKDAFGNDIAPKTNSKGDSMVQFSLNPEYKLGLTVLKPFDNIFDMIKAKDLEERYSILHRSCIAKKEKETVMVCGFCQKNLK